MLTSILYYGYTTNCLSIHLMEKFFFSFPVFGFYHKASMNINIQIVAWSYVFISLICSCFSGITDMPCPNSENCWFTYFALFFNCLRQNDEFNFSYSVLAENGSLSYIILMTESPSIARYGFSSCKRLSSVKAEIFFFFCFAN